MCQKGYGGDDCSVKLKYGDIVWMTLFNPNTIQEDLIKPAKSIPRMGHSLHFLNDGHLLMFGGYSFTEGVMNDLYLLNIEKNSWNKVRCIQRFTCLILLTCILENVNTATHTPWRVDLMVFTDVLSL